MRMFNRGLKILVFQFNIVFFSSYFHYLKMSLRQRIDEFLRAASASDGENAQTYLSFLDLYDRRYYKCNFMYK